jgi:hypothetical protein
MNVSCRFGSFHGRRVKVKIRDSPVGFTFEAELMEYGNEIICPIFLISSHT